MAVLHCLLQCQPYRVDPARLAAADPDRREVLREDDRVRADVLAHAPGEDEIAPAGLVGLAARDLHPLAVGDVPLAVLHERAAEHALEVPFPTRKAAALAVVQDPDRLRP